MKFHKHSIAKRVLIGLSIGFFVGVAYTFIFRMAGVAILSPFCIGTVMIFMLMGAAIGMVGIFTKHPIFDFPMHWWLRGSVIGFLYTLVYVLLAYDQFQAFMGSSLISWMGLHNPLWAVIDGVFIGLFMGFVETKIGGEGKDLPVR